MDATEGGWATGVAPSHAEDMHWLRILLQIVVCHRSTGDTVVQELQARADLVIRCLAVATILAPSTPEHVSEVVLKWAEVGAEGRAVPTAKCTFCSGNTRVSTSGHLRRSQRHCAKAGGGLACGSHQGRMQRREGYSHDDPCTHGSCPRLGRETRVGRRRWLQHRERECQGSCMPAHDSHRPDEPPQ